MLQPMRLIAIVLALASLHGCESPSPPIAREEPTTEVETPDKQQELLELLEAANREAVGNEPPEAVIELPDVQDWIRSDRRSLPSDDEGFSIAYDHPAGVTVTLFQYTRSLPSISSDLNNNAVQDEMQNAKSQIDQATQLGFWKDSTLVDSGIISLGESEKQCLWCRYKLAVDDGEATSDIYLWSYKDRFLKIRCTCSSLDSEPEKTALTELLTAFGNACE